MDTGSHTTDIATLLNPRGVAVIGASSDPSKVGHKIVQNILTVGYQGTVIPVNPRGGELLGLPVAPRIEEIAGRAEVAVVAIQAQYVLGCVKQCADAGVKFLVVVSSGFSEVGNIEGEQALVAEARARGMRVLGPNIFGIYSAKASLNAGFAPADITPGGVAIITQSGAMGGAMIGKTDLANIGLSALIPVGNKADITEADLLAYFAEDDSTEAVLIYLEGVRDGRALYDALLETTKRKPVIVIKSGRSERGAQAAASHTGSLSGSDVVFDHLMRQCGALRAEHLDEALLWCLALGTMPVPRGPNTVVITNGGGAGVAASDACEKYGVLLHDDPEPLERAFRPVTPALGSTKNPIDMTGEAGAEAYQQAVTAAAEEESVHAALVIVCETAMLGFDTLPAEITAMHRRFQEARKPISLCLLGGKRVEECLRVLQKKHITATGEIYAATSALGAVFRNAAPWRRSEQVTSPVVSAPIDREAVAGAIDNARQAQRTFLLADEGYAVLRAAGIATPKTRVARNLGEATQAGREIGFPVVMKILSPDILHKTDVGGVALDLESEDEIIDAYQAIRRSCRQALPSARLEGVEVSAMIKGGAEFILGARRDPVFGPIVMFGLGGVYVELIKDVTFRAAPPGQLEIIRMIEETRAHRLLAGFRGEDPLDQPAVVRAIGQLSRLVISCPRIADVEINPLAVFSTGATAVDVRIMLDLAE